MNRFGNLHAMLVRGRKTRGTPGHHIGPLLFWYGLLFACSAFAQLLPSPERPTNSLSGTGFAARIAGMSLPEREELAYAEIFAGNIPPFLHQLCPVEVTNVFEGATNKATFFVTPDYLAIGSDSDYFLMPLSPQTGQRIADALGCSLPTRKMVDAIYATAAVKLVPSPIPPSPAMTSVAVFSNHNVTVHAQRAEQLAAHPLGALVAGHKKDVVISRKLAGASGHVAIYGWHRTNGLPIQQLYLGHTSTWVDYSQCYRLVQQRLLVNGEPKTISEVLANPALAGLISDEGPISNPRYPTNATPAISDSDTNSTVLPNQGMVQSSLSFRTNGFRECLISFKVEPEVRALINVPAAEASKADRKVLLVFYALPNGNTIEQTAGKLTQRGDDWHYDIQHIGAQTRFLRDQIQDRTIAVAYLENALQSWPAWRKKYGDQRIPEILAVVRSVFPGLGCEFVLSAHSGGGSLLFGYFNVVEKIPDEVVRIAFLDSTYAYDRSLGHLDKLAAWLRGENHFLCVLAYNDAVAQLDGKPFVSANGGTWGKSHAMQYDLSKTFQFTSRTNNEFETYTALNGRVQFILRENPERKVLHTVQVELNGFIHSLLSGTTNERDGYEYFGPRAYSKWLGPE